MSCCIMDIGSNVICSPEINGTELVLGSLDGFGLIVADEITETRIGVARGMYNGWPMSDIQKNRKGRSEIKFSDNRETILLSQPR
jgi:hypothetical protein